LERVVEILSSRLSDLPGFVKAVILFGSTARGEATETSDIDLLVLHEGLQGLSPVKRRRLLYTLVMERISDFFEAVTVIDMDYSEFTKPEQVTPLLLNIYWDGVVVIDRSGKLSGFLSRVRKRIIESGLKHVKEGREYYWILPKPLEKVVIVEPQPSE